MKIDWRAMSQTVFILIVLASVAKSQLAEDSQQNKAKTVKRQMEGQPCVVEETMEIGRCKKISSCFRAEEIISQGGNFTLCGYLRDEPVVCCRNNSVLENPPERESLPGDDTIRKRKCDYYYQQVEGFDRGDDSSDDKYALDGEFPHVVAVGYKHENGSYTWGCTGTLISEKFVLAAASCARHFEYGDVNTVRLAATDLSQYDPLETSVREIFLRHENTTTHYCDDIALIKLVKSVNFSARIYPACLPANSWVPNDVTAVGWGLCSERGGNDFQLRKERIRIHDISQIKCQGVGRQEVHLNNETLCTDSFDAGLYIQTSIKYYTIYGISSYAQICITEDENYKIKYTNVGKHVKWIERKVWPEEAYYQD